MNYDLTPDEKEIIDYVESNKAKSVPNVKDEMSKYTTMAKEYTTKKKALSIGINYQNIIQSLIHQYTHDKIKPTL
ncbi:hypothetical protein KJ870_10040 [bacterium]|nr:hypothetical protein [bacterium]MBU1435267.1 hypothetical protein [bacterium]MBU1502256.1 hypothetical protein [bacterium]